MRCEIAIMGTYTRKYDKWYNGTKKWIDDMIKAWHHDTKHNDSKMDTKELTSTSKDQAHSAMKMT